MARGLGRVLRTRPKSAVGGRSPVHGFPWVTARPIDKLATIRPLVQDAAPGEPQADLPAVELHVLDHVVRGVIDEVPGALAA
jgi:hypothetical protein